MRLRDLQTALDAVPDFTAPQAALEQYRTPTNVAAALLWEANIDDALAGKSVLDLGCGTGVLSLGASLLGATVQGVDSDPDAIAIAKTVVPDATFTVAELKDWSPPSVETVVMNPPFGSQKKGADRPFHSAACHAATESIWFLQQPVNERFLRSFYSQRGKELERIAVWDYPLDARFSFHSESLAGLKVAGYLAT